MFNRACMLASVFSLSIVLAVDHVDAKGAPKPKNAVDQVDHSHGIWEKLNKEAKGNYVYTVSKSFFSGMHQTTTITVRDNKVIERRFVEKDIRSRFASPDKKPEGKPDRKWIEKGRDIGKHKEGARPKTIDQLYIEAILVAATQLKDFQKLYVGFHKNGVLKHCFFVDTRIADDAPTNGVRISSVTMGGE